MEGIYWSRFGLCVSVEITRRHTRHTHQTNWYAGLARTDAHKTTARADTDRYWLFSTPLDKMWGRLRWALMLSGCQETEDTERTNAHSPSAFPLIETSASSVLPQQREELSRRSIASEQIPKPSGLMLINPALLTLSLCQLICLILHYPHNVLCARFKGLWSHVLGTKSLEINWITFNGLETMRRTLSRP